MSLGLIGLKRGMTRVFTDEGESIPVTLVEVCSNRVVRIKTQEKDGYKAVQITHDFRRQSRVSRPMAGEFAKSGVDAGRRIREFRLVEEEGKDLVAGSELNVELFEVGQKVDVTGTTIGKGFAGTIKRHNFKAQDASHGNSISHRVPGSIGQCQTPGRVFKGKRMAGHMGDKQRTAQGLEVVRIDSQRNFLLIKGSVPGSRGGELLIRPSVKRRETRK
jgi:large subunit ribosomal protein L3